MTEVQTEPFAEDIIAASDAQDDVSFGTVYPSPVSNVVAPVDVYRILKRASDDGVLERETLARLSREIAALFPTASTEGKKGGEMINEPTL